MMTDNTRSVIIASLEKMIGWKYLETHKMVTLEAIASVIASDLAKDTDEAKKRQDISFMFEVMEKYFNSKFQEWINELNPPTGNDTRE